MKIFSTIILILYLTAIFVFAADQNIYINSSTSPGGNGSISRPHDSFADINWTTGGANSIFDWIAAGDDVTITLLSDMTEKFTFGAHGAPGHPIVLNLNSFKLNVSGIDYGVYANGKDFCTITGPGLITNSTSHGIFALVCDNFTVKNLSISNYGSTEGNHDGIRIVNNSRNFLIDSVDISGGIGNVPDGIDVSSAVGQPLSGKIIRCNIHDITGTTYAQGVKFPGDDKTTDIVSIEYCLFSDINGYGVTVGARGKTTVVQCTFINMGRYGFYSSSDGVSEGRKTFLYNNIFYGTSQVHISVDNRYEIHTGNKNIISDTVSSGLFRDIENSVSMGLAEFQTLESQDINSIKTDPLLTSTGKLYSGSPGLNTGLVLTGINDGGELDLWGNVTDSTPNIGVYQGDGLQIQMPPETIRSFRVIFP